jgi:hypothetical protein
VRKGIQNRIWKEWAPEKEKNIKEWRKVYQKITHPGGNIS